MKKVFLFSAMFIFGQTLFAQLSLDTIWQKYVIDNYYKFNNSWKRHKRRRSKNRGNGYGV